MFQMCKMYLLRSPAHLRRFINPICKQTEAASGFKAFLSIPLPRKRPNTCRAAVGVPDVSEGGDPSHGGAAAAGVGGVLAEGLKLGLPFG